MPIRGGSLAGSTYWEAASGECSTQQPIVGQIWLVGGKVDMGEVFGTAFGRPESRSLRLGRSERASEALAPLPRETRRPRICGGFALTAVLVDSQMEAIADGQHV